MVATARQTEAALRRAAILISNLDAQSRSRLLAQLPPREASRLRAAAANLVDVDPLEASRIVKAFLGRVTVNQIQESTAHNHPPAGSSATANSGQEQGSGEESSSTPRSQLQFLSQVSDVTLGQVVRNEHPQTVAVVLGALPPRQAASLLKRLSADLRREALRRLGRLEQVPAELLEEIAEHLRATVGAIEPIEATAGRKTLTSILSTLSAEERQWVTGDLADSDGVIASALQQLTAQTPASPQSSAPPAPVSPAVVSAPASPSSMVPPTLASAGVTEPQLAKASEISAHTDYFEQLGTQPAHSSDRTRLSGSSDVLASPVQGAAAGETPQAPHASTAGLLTQPEVEHILTTLAPKELLKVLATLSGREAILTLCCLDSAQAKRVMRCLPRRQAKDVRKRIENLGGVTPQEVTTAQHAAAIRALELFEPESAAQLRASARADSDAPQIYSFPAPTAAARAA